MSDGETDMADSRELLIRLDERLRNVVANMETREIFHKSEMERLVGMFTGAINTFTTALTANGQTYATKTELETATKALSLGLSRIERLVYGAVGLILIAVVGALLSLILK